MRRSAALAAAGVEVCLRHRVVEVEPTGALRVASPGGTHRSTADAVVLAMPHAETFRAAPSLAEGPLAGAAGLGASPIVNVHVVYDRTVTDLPFAAAVDSPVQWLFDRTQSSGVARVHRGAQYLAITMSAADDMVDVPSRSVLARFRAELARLLPRARRAEVLDSFVTRERRATFDQVPGCTVLRPEPGAGPGVLRLAGAWTDTGWPDTMESAVRSGIRAAETVLRIPSEERRRFAA